MYKAYKFRIQPNNEQQIALAKSFGCARWFGNYSLNLCQETYQTTGKGITRKVIQGLLPGLKKINETGRIHSVSCNFLGEYYREFRSSQ